MEFRTCSHRFAVTVGRSCARITCNHVRGFPQLTAWPGYFPRSWSGKIFSVRIESPNLAIFTWQGDRGRAWVEAVAAAVTPPVLLAARGIVVLHGALLATRGVGSLILGHPGQGKSTLSEFLRLRGHQFGGDNDIGVAISGGTTTALPGRAMLKLLPDSAEFLGTSWHDSPRLLPSREKRVFPRSGRDVLRHPLPIARIYVLEPGNTPAATPISSSDTFLSLAKHTYGVQTLGILDPKRHFEAVSALARTCKAWRLCRGSSFDQLPEVARILEEHAGIR